MVENTILSSAFKLDKFLGDIAKGNLKLASELLNISYPDLLIYINKFHLDKYKSYIYSNKELDLSQWLESLNLSIITHNRDIINPKEIDVYFPDYNLAIEFNGNYWHSANILGKNYHQKKTFDCLEKGVRLLHIYEFEWDSKREVIEKYLEYLLDINLIRLEMKDCYIEEINNYDATFFLNKNLPLTRFSVGEKNIAIKKDNEIIALMSFNLMQGSCWELLSFINNLSYNLERSYSTLLSYFENIYKPDLIRSYCDIGKFWGDTWEELGFSLKEVILPEEIYNNGRNFVYNSGKLLFEKELYKN